MPCSPFIAYQSTVTTSSFDKGMVGCGCGLCNAINKATLAAAAMPTSLTPRPLQRERELKRDDFALFFGLSIRCIRRSVKSAESCGVLEYRRRRASRRSVSL